MTNLPPSPSGGQALAQLAQRLNADPVYMASVLDVYRTQERLDVAGLAAFLGISTDGLTRLALCKRPSSGQSNFAEQTRQIAKYAGVEIVLLAQLIRQVEALVAIRSKTVSATNEEEASQPARNQLGWLAAARDRTETDDDQDQADNGGPQEPEQ